ncbi:MAG: transposase, partial [Alphaproteobacteria bacterium]
MENERLFPISLVFFKKMIEPLILKHDKRPGRPPKISHYRGSVRLADGHSWRDLPPCFGMWHTVYTRFKRWSENGLFEFILSHLQQPKRVKVDLTWVDSTMFAIHRHGGRLFKKKGPQSVGRGRKGLSTKIHMALGPTVLNSVCLSEGQRADMKVFPKLWARKSWETIVMLLRIKGTISGVLPSLSEIVGESQSSRVGRNAVKRALLSNDFSDKRICTRFDKLDATFLCLRCSGIPQSTQATLLTVP